MPGVQALCFLPQSDRVKAFNRKKACAPMHTHMPVHTHAHTRTRRCIPTHTSMHTSVHTHAHNTCTCLRAHMPMHTHTHAHICACTHAYTALRCLGHHGESTTSPHSCRSRTGVGPGHLTIWPEPWTAPQCTIKRETRHVPPLSWPHH